MPTCPNCISERSVKNGRIHTGKQRYKCLQCGRQNARAAQQEGD